MNAELAAVIRQSGATLLVAVADVSSVGRPSALKRTEASAWTPDDGSAARLGASGSELPPLAVGGARCRPNGRAAQFCLMCSDAYEQCCQDGRKADEWDNRHLIQSQPLLCGDRETRFAG